MELNVYGHSCYLDKEDLPKLKGYKLNYTKTKTGKDIRFLAYHRKLRYKTQLSRVIMGLPPLFGKIERMSLVVHHKNSNTQDNRKRNLEVCTFIKNCEYAVKRTLKLRKALSPSSRPLIKRTGQRKKNNTKNKL